MKKMHSHCRNLVYAMGIVFFSSCSKEPLSLNRFPSVAPTPICDTCTRSAIAVVASDKTVLIFPQKSDWAEQGNGRFECNLEHLLYGQAGRLDSFTINEMYVGTGTSSIQIKPGFLIGFDGSVIGWFGNILDFQNRDLMPPPESMAIRLEITFYQ